MQPETVRPSAVRAEAQARPASLQIKFGDSEGASSNYPPLALRRDNLSRCTGERTLNFIERA